MNNRALTRTPITKTSKHTLLACCGVMTAGARGEGGRGRGGGRPGLLSLAITG